jgi:diacylglycerol kinase
MISPNLPYSQSPAAPDQSWRQRRRSRLAEVVDGGAMMFADVAVVRAAVATAVMLALAFLARHRSPCAWALALAACAFLFSEMLNTLVEMLVDRISLEANVFSARIKHAAAFLSACVGAAAVVLVGVVLYQAFGSRGRTDRARGNGRAADPAKHPMSAPPPAAASPPAAATSPPAAATSPPAAATSPPAAAASPPAAAFIPPEPAHLEPARLPAVAPLRWLRRPGRAAIGTVRPENSRRDASVMGKYISRRVMQPAAWVSRTSKKRRYRDRRVTAEV